MILNHFSNRLHPDYYETVIEMLVANLGFVILRRTPHAIWLRQPGRERRCAVRPECDGEP